MAVPMPLSSRYSPPFSTISPKKQVRATGSTMHGMELGRSPILEVVLNWISSLCEFI
ncbi:hypothetical protein Glove_320g5 [Diversispora epigaea]|uniref:Uncharacterized protein n=1 Tax=Diversispora epigaea TaxID=1348612 RepID=A0A397HPG8_9GLOM|nr:hypothetical protein Glove_320g5 [Diversispora epigaea]